MFDHPWIWLNEPQHGTAVQALTGIISTAAAIAAGIFAALAYFAAKRQADEAHAQTELAKQAVLDEKERATAEVRRIAEEQRARIDEKIAVEDARRPTFRTGGWGGTEMWNMDFYNRGASCAINVMVINEEGAIIAEVPYVASGGSFNAVVKLVPLAQEGYRVSFITEFGSTWHVRVFGGPTPMPRDEVLHVVRPYDIG